MAELKNINGPVNIVGEIEATSLDINGNAEISGTLGVAGNATFTADVYVHHNDGLQIGDTGNNSTARTTLTSFNVGGNSRMKIKGGNFVHSTRFETSKNDFQYAEINSSYNGSDSTFNLYKSNSDTTGTAATTTISTGTSTFAGHVSVNENSPYADTGLHVSADDTSTDFSTTTPTNASLIVSNSDSAYGIHMGSYGSGKGVIQVRRTNAATYYDLDIQPHGGQTTFGGNVRLNSGELFLTEAGSARKPVRLYQSGYKGAIALERDGVGTVRITGAAEIGDTYFNATNVNIGIGTTTPSAKLDVVGEVQATSLDINGAADISGQLDVHGTIRNHNGSFIIEDSDSNNQHVMLTSNATEGVVRVNNGSNWGLIARGIVNSPRLGAYHGGTLDIYGFGASDGADHADDDLLAQFNFGGEFLQVNGALDINGNADISGNLTLSSAYPRIFLTDSDNNDDYSIINNNGTFLIYNDTDSSVPLAIAGDNAATFIGTVDITNTTDATDSTGDTGALRVEGGISSSGHLYARGLMSRMGRAETNSETNKIYPLGHYTTGKEVFSVDPTWTEQQLQEYFDLSSTQVAWATESDAPAGWSIRFDGGVNVGYPYSSGVPLIPIDDTSIYFQECYIKNVGTDQTHYMGSAEKDENFANPSTGQGNTGTFGYHVMANFNPGSSWTRVTGYITGRSGTASGAFETDANYFSPLALFNYGAGSGTRACIISGWRIIKIDKQEYFNNGTASEPAITNYDDPDTGIYWSATNELSLTTGGTNRMTINATAATFAGNITLGSGNITLGSGSTENRLRTFYSDNSYTDIHGYGLFMSRTTSYIRPTADGTQTLYVGASSNTWNYFSVDANNVQFQKNGTSTLTLDGSGNATFAGNVDFSNNKGLTWAGSHTVRVESNVLKMGASGGINLQSATSFTNTLTVGVDDTGYDVKFFGATSGASWKYGGSGGDGVLLTHPTGATGLEIYTISGGITAVPQLKIGRSTGQYWGVFTGDLDANIIHRQDETGEAMKTNFQQWDSNTSDTTGKWQWQYGDGSGGSLQNVMVLDQGGNLSGLTTIQLNDNSQVKFGTGSDVTMKFDGSDLVTTVPAGSAFLIGTNGGTPNDNSGNADFVVDVNGDPQLSLWSGQAMFGGTNMNWEGKFGVNSSNLQMGAWNRDIIIYNQGSAGATTKSIFIKAQANDGGYVTRAEFSGDNGTILTGATKITGNLQVGVNDTGHDVVFYGATSGKHMHWAENSNGGRLNLNGGADLYINQGHMHMSQGSYYFKNATDGTQRHGFVADGQYAFENVDLRIQASQKLYLDGGSDTYIQEVAGNEIAVYTGALKRLTVDYNGLTTPHNLVFSAAGDIVFPDNLGAALEFKEGSNLYMRFVTTNSGEQIQIEKPTIISNSLQVNAFTATGLNLPSGGVINFHNSDVTLTHSSNTLTIAGGDLIVPNFSTDTVAIVEDAKSTGPDGAAGDGQAPVTITGAGAGNESNVALKLVGTIHGNAIKMKMVSENASGNSTGAGILSYEPDDDEFNIGQSTTHSRMGISIGNTVTIGSSDVIYQEDVTIKSRAINMTANANHFEFNGDIIKIGNNTTTRGKLYNYKNGTWTLADKDAEADADGLLAMAVGTNSTTHGMLLRGTMTLDYDPGAAGDVLYVGDSGAITNTAPSATGDIIRIVGYLLAGTHGNILFDPDKTFVEVA